LIDPTLKTRAIRLLARREYSRHELQQRLASGGAARDDIAAVLSELEAAGYLSNQRYARALASQRAGRYSRRSIAGTLKAKGIEGDDIAAALAESSPDDTVAMQALWQRRFGAAPATEREKARQVRFLQARGFALSAIFKMLREIER